MKKTEYLFALIIFLFGFSIAKGQKTFSWTCGNQEVMQNLTPSQISDANNADAIYQKNIPSNFPSIIPNPPATYLIPVVVHNLYSAPSEYLSYNQILWQIQALNIAFQKLYPQYNGKPNGAYAVNTQIQFCLAQNTYPSSLNWTNLCEPGVMRYPVSATDMDFQNTTVGQNTLMAVSGVPTNFPHDRYLNIYLVNSIGGNPLVAIGMLPSIISPTNPLDGIVITNNMFGDNTILGNNFNLNSFTQEGKILAHEAGHYLGLYHTFETAFGGTCSGNTGANCATGGDKICDTPSDDLTFTSCNITANSCVDVGLPMWPTTNPPDMPENFMDYELDNCYNTFTNNQAQKMWGVLSTPYLFLGRQDMILPANLAVTGLTNAASCCPNGPLTAYFTHSLVAPCSLTANFTNLVPVTCNASTSYTWDFGDASFSNSLNPSHTYASGGDYTVTCTTGNLGCATTSYTVPITIGFSPSFTGVTSPTICAGQHQNMKFQINGTKPYNVSYSNGVTTGAFTSTLTQLEITVPTPTNITGPTNQSYTVTIGVGLPCSQTFVVNFSVVNCCAELITNGNFNNFSTGVSSDLAYSFTAAVASQTPNYYDITNNATPLGHWISSVNMAAPPFGNFMVADSYSLAQHAGPETWLYYQNISPAPNTWYSVNALIIAGHPLTGYPYNPIQEAVTVEVIDGANVVVGAINNYVMNFNNYQFWRNFQFNFQTGASPNLPYKMRIKQVQNFSNDDGYDFYIDEVSVKAFATPANVLNVTASTTLVCLGNNVQLTSSPAGGSPQYYWSASTGTTTCSPCNPTFATPTITTVYTVQALAPNGCLSVGTKTVNVLNVAYTPTVSTSQTICAGTSATISAGALGYPANLFNFFWSPPAGTGNTVTVSPLATTIYTVSICDKSSCTPCKKVTTQITVIPFGPFTISPTNTTICQGSSFQFTSTTLPSYTWAPSGNLSCSNCQNPVATPTSNTIYAVTATNASGCTKALTATVSIIPSPTISISQTLVCSGVTTSLVASGAGTYTWLPMNTTGSVATVNVTSPIVLTIIGAAANGCKTTLVTTITPVANPTITATSASICPGTNATLTASGASSFTWNPGALTGSVVVVSPATSQIYTVTGGSGCNSLVTTQVIVYPSPTISVVVNPSGGICVPGQSITLTASGVGTYSWTDGINTYTGNPLVVTPTVSTIYTVNVVNSFGCAAPPYAVSVFVSTVCACSAPTGTLLTSLSNATISGGSYAINQNLSITSGTVQFDNAEFLIAPSVVITVNPGAQLYISDAHLYSCYDMWQGIVVQNGGRIKIGQGTLIEDANSAISISNSTLTTPYIAEIIGAVFNRNIDAITINNYTLSLTPYPFLISGNVFTSRQFTFTPTIWPVSGFLKTACTLTSSLASPYCLQGFPYTKLKSPNNSISSRMGISLNTVGLLANPTNTNLVTYNEIFIGDSVIKQNENVFDNLGVGINATASSLRVTGNVFQNGRIVSGFQGSGIRSISGPIEQTHFKAFALVNSTGNVIRNDFYDLYFDVQVSNTFITDIYGNHFYSTQQKSGYNPLTFYPGKFAVYVVTNRFMALNISYNKIFNHTNPIFFTGNYTNLTLGAFSGVAQYAGRVNIDNNNIKATNTGVITTEYVSNAITLQQPLIPPPGASTFAMDTRLSIDGNSVKDAFRGISVLNWHNGQHPNVTTNTITVEGDLITGSTRQYGVNGIQCSTLSIYANEVKGNVSLTNTISTGIYTSVNNNLSVTCNTVRAIFQGFEFAGSQPVNTTWKGNFMRNNRRGYVISNNGIIGAQGSATAAIDNQWIGGWTPFVDFGTWTDATSSATNSILYTRSTSPFLPPNNSGFFASSSYAVGSLSVATGASYLCIAPPSIIAPGGGDVLDRIAQDSVTFVANINESKFIHKNHLYRQLKHNPSLMSSDLILQNFYNASLSGCRETMCNIETNLSNGNKVLATSQLSAFTPANTIETNYKQFFEIYKAYYDYTYNTNDSLNLTLMANKCPFIEGAVVYQARALFNMIYNTVELFNDNCPIYEETNSRFGTVEVANQTNTLTSWNIEIHPNPASEDLYITGTKEKESIQVFITDVTGKLLSSYLIKTESFMGSIKLNMKDGIYFVTLLNKNNDKVVKKLVVYK